MAKCSVIKQNRTKIKLCTDKPIQQEPLFSAIFLFSPVLFYTCFLHIKRIRMSQEMTTYWMLMWPVAPQGSNQNGTFE